tara:strand:- start:152 stop:412 length:261 start_codon:yes stop_codon:yes gene_type:complete
VSPWDRHISTTFFLFLDKIIGIRKRRSRSRTIFVVARKKRMRWARKKRMRWERKLVDCVDLINAFNSMQKLESEDYSSSRNSNIEK